MKSVLFLTLLALASCSKKADPAVAENPTVTYTDAAGKETTLATHRAVLVTPPLSPTGQECRIFEVLATLPDGTTLDLLYQYVGNAAPTAKGAVALNVPVYIANYPAGNSGYGYYAAAGATGGLNVDALSPATFSGSYAGPMAVGGPMVRVAFKHLKL